MIYVLIIAQVVLITGLIWYRISLRKLLSELEELFDKEEP